MGSSMRRKGGRRKTMDASCGTSKLTNSTMPTKVSAGPPRWNALPEGPLLRMFEVMAAQDDGRNGLRESKLVCRAWRASVREVVLGDTATSRPCRPPMQTTSEQAKPAATMNTCGAMMVGSNQSKDAMNDEVEVCSKPPQLMGSSSGNMCTIAEDSAEAEQAGSVEQLAARVPKPAKGRTRSHKPSLPHPPRRGSYHSMHAQTGTSLQATRPLTRAAAAAAAVMAASDSWAAAAQAAQAASHPSSAAEPGMSNSEGAQPSSNAGAGPESFVAYQGEGLAEVATSGEVQGAQHSHVEDDCESGPDDAAAAHHTLDQQAAGQDAAEMVSQTSPGWRRLEARMEGVLPIWSIFKRFGRRPHSDA